MTPLRLSLLAAARGYDPKTTPVIYFGTVCPTAAIPATLEAVATAAREEVPITMAFYESIDDLLKRKAKLTGTVNYNDLLDGISDFRARPPIEVYADGRFKLPKKDKF